jgi:hypothetical protein
MRTSLCALLALRGATWVIKNLFVAHLECKVTNCMLHDAEASGALSWHVITS